MSDDVTKKYPVAPTSDPEPEEKPADEDPTVEEPTIELAPPAAPAAPVAGGFKLIKPLVVELYDAGGVPRVHTDTVPDNAELEPGKRPRWNLVKIESDAALPRYALRFGSAEPKVFIDGTREAAVGVLVAMAKLDQLQRNAMRAAQKKTGDLTDTEAEKMNAFFSLFRAYGESLLAAGQKPEHGKAGGGVDVAEQSGGGVKLTLVKKPTGEVN